MLTKRRMILFWVLVLSCMVRPLIVQAQEDPPLRVAILVVDVFEADSDGTPVEEFAEDETCVVAPNGQDGSRFEGVTDDAFDDIVTSALAPGDPHGVLVHRELAHALEAVYGGSLQDDATGAAEFGLSWIPTIEVWAVGSQEIVLVAIDTSEYRTTVIQDHISEAISALTTGNGETLVTEPITDIIVNMSFAYIPCDQFPNVRFQAYLDAATVISAMYPEYGSVYDELDALREETDDPATLVQGLQGEQFALVRSLVTWAEIMPGLRSALIAAYGNFYPPAISGFDDIVPATLPDDIQAFWTEIQTIAEASGAIFVASSGNDGLNAPYMPAAWPEVLSVSADYSTLEFCCCPGVSDDDRLAILEAYYLAKFTDPENPEPPTDPEEAAALAAEAALTDLHSPLSNVGEVMTNGVSAVNFDPIFGCLYGTSFAAPRMSLDEAVYLLSGGGPACSDPFPPLGHDVWDNAGWFCDSAGFCNDSAKLHCGEFDGLMTPTMPNTTCAAITCLVLESENE